MEQVCEMAKTLSVYLCYVYGFNETYLFLLFNHGRQRGRDKHSPEVVVSLMRIFFLCATKRYSLVVSTPRPWLTDGRNTKEYAF